jgi:hypothetical protein
VQRPRFFPEIERLSILVAAILLAYALAHFVNLPVSDFAFQLPGLYLSFQINLQLFVSLIVAGLTSAGADWLLRDHPAIQSRRFTLEHWLLPGLTALVISLPLIQVEPGLAWWIGFVLAGVLITIVLIAEYIVVDANDVRQPAAAATLSAISYTLLLILFVALRVTELRLVFIFPAVFLSVFLVSLRTLNLRLHHHWAFIEAAVIALIVVQWAAAMHYLPFSAVSHGLVLLAPAFAITGLIANLAEEQSLRQALVEPVLITSLVGGLAIWLR